MTGDIAIDRPPADLAQAATSTAGPPGAAGRWRWTAPAGMAVAGGLAAAASMPPVGAWPLGIVGVALVDRSLAGASWPARLRRGWLAGVALLAPTTWWMRELTSPGWVLSSVLLALVLGVAAAVVPPGPGRWLGLPGAWVLFEAVRGRWPFGGVPLSTLAIGQAGGPLAPVARVGGSLLVGLVAVAAGVAVAALIARRFRAGALGGAAAVAALALAAVAPEGTPTATRLHADVVQGGGPQGTQAIDTDEGDVFDRHLAASADAHRGADLVVWPEDVVDVDAPFTARPEADALATLSRRLDGVLVAGIIEQTGDRFTNEAAAFAAGSIVDRVGKERRVPFGEYVPFRSLIEPFAPAALPRRDALVGEGPAVLDTAAGPLGVVISWEVFFPDRARDAIGNGGQLLLNPTNGASFTGTHVQSQQVASSRLRAIETGRWVLQAAPTGFSAVVGPDGRVLARTGVSKRAVLHATVALRDGRTWAVATGDWLAVGVSGALVAAGWALARRFGGLSGPARVPHLGRGPRRWPARQPRR